MREQPPQQAPPVQRIRLRYAKRGRLRFSSHRDFSRAFERALVRAGVPMAYSSGFHPHPRISYANAAPTGAASEAEYVEIGLSEAREPAEILALLDASLPPGLDIVDAVVSAGGSIAERLEASTWEIALPQTRLDTLEAAAAAFLAAEEVNVERMTKRGLRTFDTRGAVKGLEVAQVTRNGADCAILRVVLQHGTPSVRPDDVLAGLRVVAGFEADAVLVARLAQGPWLEETGTVGDPLAIDRDTV